MSFEHNDVRRNGNSSNHRLWASERPGTSLDCRCSLVQQLESVLGFIQRLHVRTYEALQTPESLKSIDNHSDRNHTIAAFHSWLPLQGANKGWNDNPPIPLRVSVCVFSSGERIVWKGTSEG